MKKLIQRSSLILVMAVLVSCADKSAPVEIQPGLQQLEILHRVQELQRTAIAIHDAAPLKLTKPNADLIVKFTLAANDAVMTEGWQAKVKTLWNSLKTEYTPPANLLPVWNIIDALVKGLV